MGSNIRLANAADANLWLDLAKAALGDQHPADGVLDLSWIASQLDPASGHETWVAEIDGTLAATVSFLSSEAEKTNPVANLGRMLFRPGSLSDGSAQALVQSVNQIADQRGEMVVTRIAATENFQQILFENAGYICVGYQPLKHLLQTRTGMLFYVRGAAAVLVTRLPISESLPHVAELAAAALENLQISNPLVVRDGACGYALQSDLKIHDATAEDYDLWRVQAQSSNPPPELSGRFNMGFGHLRLPQTQPARALLGQKDEKMVGGLTFIFDETDRCVRLTDAFCCDDISMGALFAHAVKVAQEQLGAVYVEADILVTAPRLLKTAEQLGFVPVAYLPAFFCRGGTYADVVKLVKLNLPYSLDTADFTAHATSAIRIIDRNFEDQKIGMAIINLLRALSMFGGLGDGELRKIARLFVQKLYRAGEFVFAKGDSSGEAYIVLRGKINIQLERDAAPIAQLSDGKIFGELAFLDGSPRNAFAAAAQPSILLVVQRSAFSDLARREPNLGMVVMRNIALDLAAKLRNVNATLTASAKNG
jgi:CRP/FNR family transcriptional regulator, cyclic AMP receptor protein